MGIRYDAEGQIFHLTAQNTSYLLQITEQGYLAHLYWGRKLRPGHYAHTLQKRDYFVSFSPNATPDVSLDILPQEYPAFGAGDFRNPAYQVQLENGSTVSEFVYREHRILKGKPQLEALPATYVEEDSEAETLEIVVEDKLTGLEAVLSYTVFERFDAITRSVRLINNGKESLRLLRALSASVDMPHAQYDLLHLSGSWARERHIQKRPLRPGMQGVESRRGSSSHMQNPFIALLSQGAGETHGDVYGFSLVYSGSFTAQAEVDQMFTARVSIGINPFDFTWLLNPGESFQTPEAVLVYSPEGLGGMSRTYHKLYRTRLCRGTYRDKERPVLINNWEATYFNFTADKIEAIAKVGTELGIELFVLDDGWFGHRDSDNSSLGDWFVDRKKLPEGLEDLVARVNRLGLGFGLWFEPEMISPDSELYRAHPDWCLHVPGRRRSEARQQLVLDYSRQDVRDYIVKTVSDILASAPITYVKWDMNRNMSEIGSALLPAERQRETAHRYMLGLYEVLERITSAFPKVLFESCSGGGGRFDPGMLYYMPQTWTSDDSDAVERLKIQYGTSIVYPVSTMGAHVSAVPNHQVGRVTSLETRANVAMAGNFGYELDLTVFTEEEKALVKAQVAQYKEIRHLVQFGDQYRLLSPFEGNKTAWIIVSEDKTEAALFFFRVLGEPYPGQFRLRLAGLDPNKDYKLADSGEVYGGDELMELGLPEPKGYGDFQSALVLLKEV
ncbi:alpha-galactosidase [Gorillibacterium massiliense]|uniref:alpha-galactosidase n=1 Tax=Gorillibacterium massiliense TaxID=1280390 RepID=UPI0004B91FED|nr:alpha-galactosidase [Gorillibacterium massiliense]